MACRVLALVALLVACASASLQDARASDRARGGLLLGQTPAGAPLLAYGTLLLAGAADGTFGQPQALLAAYPSAAVSLAGAGDRTLVLLSRPGLDGPGVDPGKPANVFVGAVLPDGTPTSLLRITGPADSVPWPKLAAGEAGDAAVVWNRDRLGAISRRSPSQPFQPPTETGGQVGAVAVDGAGRVIVAQAAGASIGIRTASRGEPLHAVQTLPGDVSNVQLAAARDGQAVILSESYRTGATTLAYKTAGSLSFGPPVALSDSRFQVAPVDLAIDDHGEAIVAWEQADPDTKRYRLRGLLVQRDGTVGAPFWLSPAETDVLDAEVGMNGAGDAAVVLVHTKGADASNDVPYEVAARFRPAGGSFNGPLVLTPPGRHAGFSGPALTVGDGGNATIAWTDATGRSTDQTDPRLMTARIGAAGLLDQREVAASEAGAAPAPPLLTPPLLTARFTGPSGIRVGPHSGRFTVTVRCVSWTLDRCDGRVWLTGAIGIARRFRIAERALSIAPNSVGTVQLVLSRRARKALAAGRLHRVVSVAHLTASGARGHSRAVQLHP